MYRIEVAPGEETVFRSIEELAVGIRNGVITQRSRIFHVASQKWLPIGLHPHYKKALELPAATAAHGKPKVENARPTGEYRLPTQTAVPRVPSPTMSPVVAMQQEVLRDLPVVAIPESLPWAAARAPTPPPPAPVVQDPPPRAVLAQPTATVTYKPLVIASPAVEPTHDRRADELYARPTARRANRSRGRPLLMLGVAAALVIAGLFALTATRPAPADASDRAEPADAAAEPAEPASPEEEADELGQDASPPARVSSAPGRVRMTPGPAFAGSVPVTPGAEAPAPARKASSPAPPPSEEAPAISPAPVELDLGLPSLPPDSMVPKRTKDTMAMNKILRALNGAPASEATPAAP
jgi:hypothetical protein